MVTPQLLEGDCGASMQRKQKALTGKRGTHHAYTSDPGSYAQQDETGALGPKPKYFLVGSMPKTGWGGWGCWYTIMMLFLHFLLGRIERRRGTVTGTTSGENELNTARKVATWLQERPLTGFTLSAHHCNDCIPRLQAGEQAGAAARAAARR